MGRKCSTVFDNKSCRSGYPNDDGGFRVIAFPTDIEEKKGWLSKLPNVIELESVTKNMGICLRHWKEGVQFRTGPGGYPRPLEPPTEFGTTPASFASQTSSRSRRIEERGITSDIRSSTNTAADEKENEDVIRSWGELCDYCKDLQFATQITDEEIKIVKLGDSPLLIDFSISISKNFKVVAHRGSIIVSVRDLIDSFQWKLTLYSQISAIISRVSECTNDIQADIGHAGKIFSDLIEKSDLEEAIEKQVRFLCSQMVLTEKKNGGPGHKYDASVIRDALEIYLRSRSAYKVLRDYLILPCDKTLKSYFGKLGGAGSSKECSTVVTNVFTHLEEEEKMCYVTADEIYVNASIKYRAGHIIGLGEDQDPPKPAKTVLALMINFLYKTPSFIARLIPVTSLKAAFLKEQLMLLIKIIHNVVGSVFLVMTDNLSVNQCLFKMLHDSYGHESLSAIYHPISNAYFPVMYLCYDPVHLLKNIRNNWITEKTQTLEFKDPDSDRVVKAKWSDLKFIYKEEFDNYVKTTKLDYASLYPNNFEKQKVSLTINVFNDKTVAALKLRGRHDTAFFIEKVLQMWNIINVKGPDEGRRLNNQDRFPIKRPDDERLQFLLKMSTSLKLMDSCQRGARVRGLTGDTANAWHVTLNGLVSMTKTLLGKGVKYVCMGRIQSDHLEGEFGVIRGLSGSNYFISCEQVISSTSLRRMKLYHKLEIENVVSSGENQCCSQSLDDRDEDIFLLDSCFDYASELNESERASVYYISGYVAFKEDMPTVSVDSVEKSTFKPECEFTELVSRGKLRHPPPELYDLGLYLYSFFKNRQPKCCSKVFLEAYRHIYEVFGHEFDNIESIIRRFSNSFFKGFAKKESDNIKSDKAAQKAKKKRKLSSL